MTRRRSRALLALALAALATACARVAPKEYEYEEEMYLRLDGSALVIVNTSIPALVALHGLPLDPDTRARVDREAIAGMFTAPGVTVNRVSRPWRRDGRRFVQIEVETEDVRQLVGARPFAWSRYDFRHHGDEIVYEQTIARARGAPLGDVGWNGDELVAFRFHLPSRVEFHNAPEGEVGRGNIVAWEQPLAARLAGETVRIETRIQSTSILASTLVLFGAAFASALTVVAALIWWTTRRAEEEPA